MLLFKVFLRGGSFRTERTVSFQPYALTDFTWTTSLLNTNALEITSSAYNDYHSPEDL
jgi:hypothetical protein